jgi:hypothetical protein
MVDEDELKLMQEFLSFIKNLNDRVKILERPALAACT